MPIKIKCPKCQGRGQLSLSGKWLKTYELLDTPLTGTEFYEQSRKRFDQKVSVAAVHKRLARMVKAGVIKKVGVRFGR